MLFALPEEFISLDFVISMFYNAIYIGTGIMRNKFDYLLIIYNIIITLVN